MNDIPTNAIKIRKMRQLSQQDVAEIIGVEQPTISRFEKGVGSITLRVIRQIADALNVEVHELFHDNTRADDEEMLINVFRTLSPDRRQGWMDMVHAAKSSAPKADQETS